MSLEYSRYSSSKLRSFALRAFNERETEINQHYWSFVAVSEYAGYRARRVVKKCPDFETAKLFKSSGPNAPRIPKNVSKWLIANDSMQNWLRLSSLVSATANFEMYIGHAFRTVLLSDPFLRFGKPRTLDGITLLKQGIELPYADVLEGLTKGDWNSREASFLRILKVMPLVVHYNKSSLEEIRNLRNSFAHGFGRELVVPEPGAFGDSGTAKLSEVNLKKYLGVLSRVARDIDRHLMEKHIGCFDLICHFHKKSDDLGFGSASDASVARSLKEQFYAMFGITVTEKFCRSLIDGYKAAPGH